MSWTAPEVERDKYLYVGDERQMCQGMLDRHRQTLLMKCAGLTAEQLKRRSAEPSALSLLGLVRHMTEVERWWFRNRMTGLTRDRIYDTEDNPDGDFNGLDGADPEADFAVFAEEVRLADAAVAGLDLDHTVEHPTRGTLSLRWVYLHMIEEYARHNGHADILRERIDGATGV